MLILNKNIKNSFSLFKCFALLLSVLSSLLVNEFPDSPDNPSNKHIAYEQLKEKQEKHILTIMPHGVFERMRLFFNFGDGDILRMDGELRWLLWELVHKRNHIRLPSRTLVPTSPKSVFSVFVIINEHQTQSFTGVPHF